MEDQERASWWRRRAWLVAAKVNVAWVLRGWLPWAVVVGALFACAVMVAKRIGMETEIWWVWLTAGLALPLLVVGWQTRRKAFGVADGLVRLEGELRLHNALTTASKGLGAWPEPVRGRDGLKWRLDRILAPLAAVAVLLTVAWRMPMEIAEAEISAAAVEPVAWQQVDEALDELERNEAVTPESLESFREKLESLREQPREEWYRHASLEAGDELRDQLNRDVREFAEALQMASDAVSEIGANSEMAAELSERQLQRLAADAAAAMQQLGASGLNLDPKLAQQLANLQNLDANKLKSLSAEQMRQLREALQQSASQCRSMGGQTVGTDGKEGGQCQGGQCDGNCDGSGNCPGSAPGQGGITRGPGAAPLSFGEETARGSDRLEGASNDDISRAGLGDKVGQSAGSHEVERVAVGPQQSGGISDGGQGGQAVWRNNLTPAERDVLKQFFK